MTKLLQFLQRHPRPAFSEKVQRGEQGKFFKNRPKSSPRLKGTNGIILYLVCTWSAKTAKDFGAKRGSKSARMAKLWQFMQAHTKPAFSEKVQRGDQKKCFKKSLRSRPRLKGPKTHWRKWHYPLICTHLKSKHWRTFWRKQRLQKCPNGQVMAIFARSFTTRIFWKSAKGGPREIFQKSCKK